jgi:hypothetical protein
MANFNSYTIIITILMETLIPNCRFENILPTHVRIKSPNTIFMWYLGK